jgi:hypothetical protein
LQASPRNALSVRDGASDPEPLEEFMPGNLPWPQSPNKKSGRKAALVAKALPTTYSAPTSRPPPVPQT